MRVIVEADGGSRGNPGPAGYGAVVLDVQTGEVLAERSESIGVATNNVAEYSGLIAGLTAAAELNATEVAVRMDSKLVVEQLRGVWKVKKDTLVPLYDEAKALVRSFDRVSFAWIPREENTRADRLANEAMDRAAGIEPRASRTSQASKARPKPPADSWTPPTDTATRIVLVRHGSTEHSVGRRFSGRNDLPLSDVGQRQAAALAARAAAWKASAVLSSPLPRALQTAEAIATALDLAVEVQDDLVEVDFGEWEGKTFAEAGRADPDALRAWLADPDVAPPGGESFEFAALRTARARDAIVTAHPGQTVIAVTHVTPIKTLLRLALDAPASALFRIHLDTGSVSVIDYYGDDNVSVRLVNDTSHLG